MPPLKTRAAVKQVKGKGKEVSKQTLRHSERTSHLFDWSCISDLLSGLTSTAITIDSDLDSDHSLPPPHSAFTIRESSSTPVAPSMRQPSLGWLRDHYSSLIALLIPEQVVKPPVLLVPAHPMPLSTFLQLGHRMQFLDLLT
jgi:hypothetical protein